MQTRPRHAAKQQTHKGGPPYTPVALGHTATPVTHKVIQPSCSGAAEATRISVYAEFRLSEKADSCLRAHIHSCTSLGITSHRITAKPIPCALVTSEALNLSQHPSPLPAHAHRHAPTTIRTPGLPGAGLSRASAAASPQ